MCWKGIVDSGRMSPVAGVREAAKVQCGSWNLAPFGTHPWGSSRARGQDSELESSDGYMDEDSADDTFS